MKIRRRMLPPGWYPDSESEILQTIQEWKKELGVVKQTARAGIAPHAGWFFSGALAFQVVSSFVPAETCIVVGGHLSPRDRIHLYLYDAFETPLGELSADSTLMESIAHQFNPILDSDPDNTVEIQLPLIKACFPSIRVVCLRCPPSVEAIHLGEYLGGLMRETERSFTVLGSTDLTHYGPNYGFMPKGMGKEAMDWVMQENDRGFLTAAQRMDVEGMLTHALEKNSACSAGAAAVAASFARTLQLKGQLLSYATSWEKHRSSSFVGYGAVIYT